MSKIQKATGGCVCGAVTITAGEIGKEVHACHCDTCRKWTGGVFLSVSCGQNVSFTGEDNIERYDSSEWAARGFCKKCGTHLFYYLKPKQQYIMPVALFDDSLDVALAEQLFIDKKPDYYTFSEDTHNMTGEEVFAEYA